MKKNTTKTLTSFLLFVFLFCTSFSVQAQVSSENNTKSFFWDKVQFGGAFGLGIGNNYTNITIAPSAIYNFNRYFAAGLGIQYTYVKQKNYYESNLYGGSIVALFHPIEQIQISAELEQLRVNTEYNSFYGGYRHDFWNTALFLGAGFRTNNVTIGVRYNVLHKDDDGVYADAFMPFIRVYF
jgi:hypothetical protein